jgi:hypothetical protein
MWLSTGAPSPRSRSRWCSRPLVVVPVLLGSLSNECVTGPSRPSQPIRRMGSDVSASASRLRHVLFGVLAPDEGGRMPVLIPERTIDSTFAFEILSAAPTALLWSPAQNQGAGRTLRTPDHELRGARRKLVFECKTIYTPSQAPTTWVVRIPTDQLDDYIAQGLPNLVYVLPALPHTPASPWLRTGCTDPEPDTLACSACANPTLSSGGPVYWRRWAGRYRPVSTAPAHQRLLPWFNHWAWCVTARSLRSYLWRNGAPRQIVDHPAQDNQLQAIPGATRLCHLLAVVQCDNDNPPDGPTGHGSPTGPADRFPDDADGRARPLGDDEAELLNSMSTESLEGLVPGENETRLVVAY